MNGVLPGRKSLLVRSAHELSARRAVNLFACKMALSFCSAASNRLARAITP